MGLGKNITVDYTALLLHFSANSAILAITAIEAILTLINLVTTAKKKINKDVYTQQQLSISISLWKSYDSYMDPSL